MPSAWVDHIREFARENGVTYGCALSMPECRDSYRAKKELLKNPPPPPEKRKRGGQRKYKTEEEVREARRIQSREAKRRSRAAAKEARDRDKEMQGEGIKKGFKRLARATKRGLQKGAERIGREVEGAVKDVEKFGKALIYGRMDYPPKVRAILNQYGDEVIVGYTIKRTPVSSVLTSALSAVSLGAFGKRFGRSEYDELFHLFLEMETQSGKRIAVEKNEVINMEVSPKPRPKEEIKVVQNPRKDLTLRQIMDATEEKMGKRKFFGYSARDNNCQDFLSSILKANSIGNEQDIAFIKQNTKELFKNLPFLRKFSNTITDIGARVDVLTQGAGLGSSKIKPVKYDVEKRLEKKDPIDLKAIQKRTLNPTVKSTKATKKMLKEMQERDNYTNLFGRGLNPSKPNLDSNGIEEQKMYCPHCDSEMEGSGLGKKIRRAAKRTVKKVSKPVSKAVKQADRIVFQPTGDYVTAKKGGLASDVITYGIPAASGAVLGAAGGVLGGPVAGVAGSALGSKLGAMGAAELKKSTGTGLPRAGRLVKGSQEAKDHMRRLREMRTLKGSGLYA